MNALLESISSRALASIGRPLLNVIWPAQSPYMKAASPAKDLEPLGKLIAEFVQGDRNGYFSNSALSEPVRAGFLKPLLYAERKRAALMLTIGISIVCLLIGVLSYTGGREIAGSLIGAASVLAGGLAGYHFRKLLDDYEPFRGEPISGAKLRFELFENLRLAAVDGRFSIFSMDALLFGDEQAYRKLSPRFISQDGSSLLFLAAKDSWKNIRGPYAPPAGELYASRKEFELAFYRIANRLKFVLSPYATRSQVAEAKRISLESMSTARDHRAMSELFQVIETFRRQRGEPGFTHEKFVEQMARRLDAKDADGKAYDRINRIISGTYKFGIENIKLPLHP